MRLKVKASAGDLFVYPYLRQGDPKLLYASEADKMWSQTHLPLKEIMEVL